MVELTQKQVKSLFKYKNGVLYWKNVGHNRKVKNGDRAGYIRKDGYEQIKINSKPYLTHRIIFLYHRGYLPRYLDHKDGDPLNNKIRNIREATNSQNRMNSKPRKGNNGKKKTSQYCGVSFQRGKWIAYINKDGVRKNLGNFTNENDAATAYNNAAIILHKEFAKLNIIEDDKNVNNTTCADFAGYI